MRIHRDERGQTIILVALSLPLMLGFVGIATDVGALFKDKRTMQTAADAAAIAGALNLNYGELRHSCQDRQHRRTAITDGSNGVTVTVNDHAHMARAATTTARPATSKPPSPRPSPPSSSRSSATPPSPSPRAPSPPTRPRAAAACTRSAQPALTSPTTAPSTSTHPAAAWSLSPATRNAMVLHGNVRHGQPGIHRNRRRRSA